MATVLVVEDNEDNLLLAQTIMEDAGYAVLTCTCVRDALELLRSKPVDLVLMDIMMPEIDGYEAIEMIRSDTALKCIPVIAVTACAMQGDQERIIGSGFDDYVSKPYEDAKLLEKVRLIMAQGGPERWNAGVKTEDVPCDDSGMRCKKR